MKWGAGWRRWLLWVGIGLVLGVFAVGAIVLVKGMGSAARSVMPKAEPTLEPLAVVKTAGKANFDYLVPATGNNWTFDSKTPVFDESRGVVSYLIRLSDEMSPVDVTISQQRLPDKLKPRDSPAFNAFIFSSDVAASRTAGSGKIYFKTALQNGKVANGSTTVIYVTDEILLFGQANTLLGFDKWSGLMAAMRPQSSK